MRFLAVITVITLLSAALGGCNTSGCLDNQNSLPLAGFYASETGSPVSLDSLDIGGVGAVADSLLVKAGQSVSSVYLPLRSQKDFTEFFIHYAYPEQGLDDETLNDTIGFTYTSQPYFASEECGAMYRYKVSRLDYTTHLIDSVILVDSLITNVDTERLRIYFKVTTMEPEEPENPDSPDNPAGGDDNPTVEP